MKRCLPVLAMPLLLAAGPTPLVVGSVRDQYGAPIAGAHISSGSVQAQTDAQGTFALQASGVARVSIACSYCETVTVPVEAGEPVVAIVRRYDAIAQEAPSDRDVASVPYSRGESIAALTPFTVLENSSYLLPGAEISDRGASSRGGLVVQNGIPVYDVASGQSPFAALPLYAVQRAVWLNPASAFEYGDLAGGGTFVTDTHADARWSGVAGSGSGGALRAGETLDTAAWSLAASHDPGDDRAGADGSLHDALGDGTFDVAAVVSEDRLMPGSQRLDTSNSGFRADYNGMRDNRTSASITANAGGYDGGTAAESYSAKWSDLQVQGGVATNARIQFFANAGVRASSGYYWTSSPAFPLTAGTSGQTRIDMGAQTSGDRYSARIGVGAFGFRYSGGSAGSRGTFDGGIALPSFSGTYAFGPRWSLELQAGESFTLPTMLEAFVSPAETPNLIFDRNLLFEQTLSYGDLRRFRASITSMSERVSGLDTGTIHSAGFSAAWQIAPALSLRAWLLRENDFTQPYETIYRFGARALPATVGSYWLTYETAGVRIDAIYRRDLLDYEPDPHFDASMSAPIYQGWRLFAATERHAGTRAFTVGLRALTP